MIMLLLLLFYNSSVINIFFIFQTVDHGKYYYAAHVVFMVHIEYAVSLNVFKHGTVQHVKPYPAAIIKLSNFRFI